jgi:hypothetical protein
MNTFALRLIFISFPLLLTAFEGSYAQGVEFFVNAKGEAFKKRYDPDIEGDPFYTDKWLPATVNTDKGMHDNIKVKYDLHDDMLIFVHDTSEEPLRFVDEVKGFTLFLPEKINFANDFPAIDKQTTRSFYQVLSSGRVTLLKRSNKMILDVKNYNATVTRSFQLNTSYYLYKDGKMEKVDPKKALYTLAGDKKSEFENYAKANSLGFKKDEDLARLYDRYNTKLN